LLWKIAQQAQRILQADHYLKPADRWLLTKNARLDPLDQLKLSERLSRPSLIICKFKVHVSPSKTCPKLGFGVLPENGMPSQQVF
jgi:hypothetical protein